MTTLFFTPTIPDLIKQFKYSKLVGSSHGLLCLYGDYKDGTKMVVLWNPSIRKSIGIEVPEAFDWPYDTVVGFGVCPITNDSTIVKITHADMTYEIEKNICYRWEVEIFSLRLGEWRPYSSWRNLPHGSIKLTFPQVVIDRFIYWYAYDKNDGMHGRFETYNLIMSFDMITQEFRAIDLPDNLSHRFYLGISISKIFESLVVLEYNYINTEGQDCVVWLMEHGVTNSFTKLFTINPSYKTLRTLGFRKNGQAILEGYDDDDQPSELVLYGNKTCSEPFFDLDVSGEECLFFVKSYTETLFLLDQSDSKILF